MQRELLSQGVQVIEQMTDTGDKDGRLDVGIWGLMVDELIQKRSKVRLCDGLQGRGGVGIAQVGIIILESGARARRRRGRRGSLCGRGWVG